MGPETSFGLFSRSPLAGKYNLKQAKRNRININILLIPVAGVLTNNSFCQQD
jgi:hypothetical protein